MISATRTRRRIRALLDSLAASFEAHGLRLKPLVAEIMKSHVYQLSATPSPGNVQDESNFSHAAVRLLPAETLLDAISQVLDVAERFPRAPARCGRPSFPARCRAAPSSNLSASRTGS